MSRLCAPLLAGLLLAAPAAAADGAIGTWRVSLPIDTEGGETVLNLLFLFGEADGKHVADFVDSAPPLGAEPKMELTVKDDTVKFTFKFGPNNWSFDGKLDPGGKRIKGSLDLGRSIQLVELTRSTLKSLSKDKFGMIRESLDQAETPQEFFNFLFAVLSQAGANKVKPEEVRAYADKATKLAEPFGLRWQRTIAFRLGDILAGQEAYTAIAVEQARLGERMIGRADDVATQLGALETLARVLRKAKKDADAKEVEGRVAKLEVRDYADYVRTMPPFKPEEFAGRKAKSDRAVLVEDFTSSDYTESVAVDLAFDALGRTFKPGEVVLLQYHLSLRGAPDPLAAKDAEARIEYYLEKNKRSPLGVYVAGKQDPNGGGAQVQQAKVRYQGYREAIEPLLEKPAGVKLTATASLKGNELTIKGTVADLEKPGEKVALRFALAEERVRYTGGNGLRYYHGVVRALPGGAKGFPLPKASAEQTVTVSLDDLRAAVAKAAETGPALGARGLKVVAFVQNDETNEVLHAVQVDVDGGKE
ncbi:MAG TPA: hypothetical protein VM597_27440 [Gemmataceae bacterium]|nr:hypothetical protein [Gemmataceae bacterium]